MIYYHCKHKNWTDYLRYLIIHRLFFLLGVNIEIHVRGNSSYMMMDGNKNLRKCEIHYVLNKNKTIPNKSIALNMCLTKLIHDFNDSKQ